MYYTKSILNKFSTSYLDAVRAIRNNEPGALHVNISNSNSKMGAVASVSLLPFMTCPTICKNTCGANCYAAKLVNLRPSVLNSYARNTAIATLRPDVFWTAVDAACKAVRYFRFHVSGDIPTRAYFMNVVRIALNNPGTQILIFTKQYDIVNNYIPDGAEISDVIPENLHILFSGWTNLEPVNPHKFPETNVYKKESDCKEEWLQCGGNCFNCACRGVGCWQAQPGQTVAFKMH